MITIPIIAVGQEANLNFIPRFDENRFPMIARRPLNIKPPIKCKDKVVLDLLFQADQAVHTPWVKPLRV
jgi:hypothetical protein